MVLYNRSKAPNGVMIKPDMNPEERKTEAALLSERWRLIGSGIDKRDIKLRGSKLLVKGKKHGEAVNFKFVPKSPVNSNAPVVVQPPTKVYRMYMPKV